MGAAAIPAAAAGGGAILSAYGQGEAAKSQASYYNYLGSMANTNASLAQARARVDIKNIGAESLYHQGLLTRRINQTIGDQKVAMVNGVGGSSRSAQDIISSTMDTGASEEDALRYNAQQRSRMAQLGADTQSLNYRTQGAGYAMAGRNTMAASKFSQASTLLGGAGSVSSIWYRDWATG